MNYYEKQAAINKLAEIRLAINYVIRDRIKQAAWSPSPGWHYNPDKVQEYYDALKEEETFRKEHPIKSWFTSQPATAYSKQVPNESWYRTQNKKNTRPLEDAEEIPLEYQKKPFSPDELKLIQKYYDLLENVEYIRTGPEERKFRINSGNAINNIVDNGDYMDYDDRLVRIGDRLGGVKPMTKKEIARCLQRLNQK